MPITPKTGSLFHAASQAVIGSKVKVAAAGALLDVPLGHKDDSWSFPHFDTITVSVADVERCVHSGGAIRPRAKEGE
jgi:hypothetical protein